MKAIVTRAYGFGSLFGLITGMLLSQNSEALASLTRKLYAGNPNWQSEATTAVILTSAMAVITWIGINKRNKLVAQVKD